MNDGIFVGFKTKGSSHARPSAHVQTPTAIQQIPTATVQTPTEIRQLLTLIRPTPNRQLPLVIATHRTL